MIRAVRAAAAFALPLLLLLSAGSVHGQTQQLCSAAACAPPAASSLCGAFAAYEVCVTAIPCTSGARPQLQTPAAAPHDAPAAARALL